MKIWLRSLSDAWEMLTRIPIPSRLEVEAESEPEKTLACFPLVGALVGVAAYLTASLCSLLIVSDMLAAAVATLAITLGAEFVSDNGEISLLASVAGAKMKGVPVSALSEPPDSRIIFEGSVSLLIFISIYLVKLVCVGLLVFRSEPSWFIAVYALSYLLRARLAASTLTSDGRPLIETEDPESAHLWCWIAAGCAVLLGGLTSFPIPLLVLILAYFILMGYERLLEKIGVRVGELIVDIHGAAADLFFLVMIASLTT